MDKHSKEIRSYNMSMIKSSGTKPEETVRKYLFSKGLRYRKNVKTLPGKPDIVLPKYKTIVFVNGQLLARTQRLQIFCFAKDKCGILDR